MKFGFVPYKRAIEISDDPRVTGEMPRSRRSARADRVKRGYGFTYTTPPFITKFTFSSC